MDRQEQDQKTRKLSDSFRAKILVYAIEIEQQLTIIIINRFTKNSLEMVDYILYFEKTSFERKIELVKLILKSADPNLLKEYKITLQQLNQIRDIRNRLSHHHSAYAYNGKSTDFVLSPNVVRLKKNNKGFWVGKNDKKFTVKEMQGLMKMVGECDSQIRKIVEKIKKQ